METDEPKKRFTIGIVDDVTHLSLQMPARTRHRSRRHHRL